MKLDLSSYSIQVHDITPDCAVVAVDSEVLLLALKKGDPIPMFRPEWEHLLDVLDRIKRGVAYEDSDEVARRRTTEKVAAWQAADEGTPNALRTAAAFLVSEKVQKRLKQRKYARGSR